MFSIKKLNEHKKDDAENVKEKKPDIRDLAALQSIACYVVKSSIGDSGQLGAQS